MTQPAKGRLTENEKARTKWCKLARGVKAERRKTNGRDNRSGCTSN